MDCSDCAICFDAIEKGTTGQATLSCGHNFHIRCVVQWFYSQEGASSCPFCRHEVGEKEDLPTAEDMGQEESEDEDESEYSEEYGEESPPVRLSAPVLDSILQYNGGRGLTRALWEQIREWEGEYWSDYAYTTHEELNLLIAANGGAAELPDVEWDCLYARFKYSRYSQQRQQREQPEEQQEQQEQQDQREEAEWSHLLENFRVEVRPDPAFECAKKIQAVWRGFSTRRRFTTKKALPPTWILSRFLAVV